MAQKTIEVVSYISMPLVYEKSKLEKKYTQEAIIHTLVNSEDGNAHILAIAFYPDIVEL